MKQKNEEETEKTKKIEKAKNPWLINVAPMLDWTDKHCRFFHRLFSKNVRLYSEMVTTGAILNGDKNKLLNFNFEEKPVALQIGGNNPKDLALSSKIGESFGYDEINLNCGCPSNRVQKGSFGACLMLETNLVADCLKAMQDSVKIPVTIKHRIGIDKNENYNFVRDFIGNLENKTNCKVFIVHARNAFLNGISPKNNRKIPPLRYEVVQKLKKDFPYLTIILNGGIKTLDEIKIHLTTLDGVMIGREIYYNPWLLWEISEEVFNENKKENLLSRTEIEEKMIFYIEKIEKQKDLHWRNITRHILGLYREQKGAKSWRQIYSDHNLKDLTIREIFKLAHKIN